MEDKLKKIEIYLKGIIVVLYLLIVLVSVIGIAIYPLLLN